MEGISQPYQLNNDLIGKLKKKPKNLSSQEFVEGIRSGNRTILSQAITLVESSLHSHQEKAQEIIAACLQKGSEISSIQHPVSSIQHPVSSIRIGITGVPGVGKSTFIEAIGVYITGVYIVKLFF